MGAGNHNLTVKVVLGVALTMSACADKSEKKEPRAAAAKPTTSNPATTTETPNANATGESQACWDKLLKTPEATACSTLFAYSSKTCVPALTKNASCDVSTISAAYGSAVLNGQPVMTVVNQWIADGYAPQCFTGSDSKFYVYFLKKAFTAASSSASAASAGQYSIADKKLGPAGAILDSIKLEAASASAEMNCE